MKDLQSWLDEYGESHLNATNKAIHWICVPAIFFSIVGLLASIPAGFISENVPEAFGPYAHFGTVAMVPVAIFYIRHSFSIAIGMLLWCLFCLWGNAWVGINVNWPLWQFSLTVFVVAWVGQFIGHKIEGEKPSFFKDIQFLMIGPAWLMSFVYHKMGLKY